MKKPENTWLKSRTGAESSTSNPTTKQRHSGIQSLDRSPGRETQKAFFTISNFIAEAKGAHQGEEWAITLTSEATFEPIRILNGEASETESKVTRKLQSVVAVKSLQRAIEPNGEEWAPLKD